jgi:hypothetical protein
MARDDHADRGREGLGVRERAVEIVVEADEGDIDRFGHELDLPPWK